MSDWLTNDHQQRSLFQCAFSRTAIRFKFTYESKCWPCVPLRRCQLSLRPLAEKWPTGARTVKDKTNMSPPTNHAKRALITSVNRASSKRRMLGDKNKTIPRLLPKSINVGLQACRLVPGRSPRRLQTKTTSAGSTPPGHPVALATYSQILHVEPRHPTHNSPYHGIPHPGKTNAAGGPIGGPRTCDSHDRGQLGTPMSIRTNMQ